MNFILLGMLSLVVVNGAEALTLRDFRLPVSDFVSQNRDESSACQVLLKKRQAPSQTDFDDISAVLIEARRYSERFVQTKDPELFWFETQSELRALLDKLNMYITSFFLSREITIELLKAQDAPVQIRNYLGYVPKATELSDLVAHLKMTGARLSQKDKITSDEFAHFRWDLALMQQISYLAEIRGIDVPRFPEELWETIDILKAKIQETP